MPIRTLQYSAEISSLDDLKNAVIGIDIQHYINVLLPPGTDPTFEAIGGFPISLKSRIIADAQHMESLDIKPVYVFPGIKPITQFSYLQQPELQYEKHLKASWKTKVANPEADISFRDLSNPYLIRLLMDEIMIILHENELEYLVAPYTQHHQLLYMLEAGVINAIYSSNDCLLLERLDNFIVDIDFTNKKFQFLSSKQIIGGFNLDFKRFRDIAMLLGNVFQPFELKPPTTTFHELVHTTRQGFNALSSLSTSKDDSSKLTHFINGCTILDFCPVLRINGKVESFCIALGDSVISSASNNDAGKNVKAKLPRGLNEVFGFHFPQELYFYQSIGMNIFPLIESFITSDYIERLPLDMKTDPIYEKIILDHKSMEMKEVLFNLFTSTLHRFFQHKKVNLKSYYTSTHRLNLIDFKSAQVSNVSNLIVRHSSAKSFDLALFLNSLNDEFIYESTVADPKEVSQGLGNIFTNYELISSSLLGTLVHYGFIELREKNFRLSKWGTTLVKFIGKHNVDIETILLLCVFFQRTPNLDMKSLSASNDLDSLNDVVDDLGTLNLIAQFATLYKIKEFKVGNYKGPVSNSLLHFNSIMSALHNEIKNFVIVDTLNLLLRNKNDIDKFNRSHEDWCSLVSELPFKMPLSNTVIGLIVEKSIESFVLSENFKVELDAELLPFTVIVQNPSKEALHALKFVISVCDLVYLLFENGLASEAVKSKFESVRMVTDKLISKF